MMKKMKFLCVILVVVLTACSLTACAGTEETNYTEELMGQAYDAVGFPDISNYFERQQLKEIYELRDDPNLICYWYTANNMTGKWVYQGKCIGYGIPYTTSMTGSESMQRSGLAGDWEVLPQAEPEWFVCRTANICYLDFICRRVWKHHSDICRIRNHGYSD